MIRKFLFPVTLVNSLIMAWFIGKIEYDTVALHYNINGVANYHGSKWMLMIFVILPLALSLGFLFYNYFTKNSQSKKDNSSVESKIISIITIFFMILGWIIIVTTSKNPQRLDPRLLSVIIVLLGLLIICISAFMPQIKPNKHLGIRTSATLRNKQVWYKTHKLGFYTGITGGCVTIFLAVISFITNIYWLGFAGIISSVFGLIVPAIYSYIIYKKQS